MGPRKDEKRLWRFLGELHIVEPQGIVGEEAT